MRTRVTVIAACGLAGILLWAVDTLLTWRVAASSTFVGALLTDAPSERVSMRLLVLVTLVVLGTIIADVTLRRHRSERELCRVNDQMDLILNSAADGIIGLDTRGRITFANPAAAAILGHEVSGLEGRPHHSLLHHTRADGSVYPEDECPITAACASGNSREIADEVMWRRDGSSVPVRYVCAPMRDGDEIVGATLVFEEIGEGERALEELARLSHLSALILTWAGEGIFGVDARGRFTFANPAAGVMLGYEPDDLVGQSVHELIHHTRADGKPLHQDQSLLLAAYRDNDVYHVGDDLFWRSDGASFPTEYTSTPLREGDTLVGMVVVFKDITERKLAEANLRQTMDDLAHSNRELEQFAYIASHDLQEPLRMVEGYMDLLVRRYSDKLDDDAREFINYAADGAGRMRRLIEDLLEYSRVGTRGRRPQPVPLNEAVDDALANLGTAIEESGASVTRDEMPTVLGDQAQLTQLYQNLIGNAIKFRGDKPPRVYLGAERDGETWRLSVADNGIGIAPEQHERIFVLFQRLHGRDKYSGTGIGLAVCRRIVERHGGKLRVRSEEGAGATFSFSLPVAVGTGSQNESATDRSAGAMS